INWLADHLKRRWPKGGGALLVVTHDRWFLDEVCTGMWEVHAGSVVPFEGGYSSYILQRVERQRLEALAKQKRANQLRKELAWLSRGAQARRSKPKFHLEKAAELIANEPPVRNPIELKNAAMARLGKQVIDLEDVAVSLDGRVILKNLTWSIGPGERIGILGENGAGKTTLLRLLEGIVQPSSGRMKTGKTVRLSSVTQGLEELAEFDDDVVRAACGRLKTFYEIDGKYYSPTALLERLGFSRDELNARCKDLSGGQRRRLRILFALLEEPNVLLLDEPGNDLDTDMMAAMEDLLDSWAGTLVVVSHDRYLLERVTDDLYAIVDGALRHMPGGVDEYLRHLNKANSMESDQGQAERKRETGASSQAYALRKKAASLERKIETQQGRVKEAQDRLDRCDPYDYEALVAAQENLDDQVGRLAQLEDEWLEVREELQ
ncbi:MAG: ABC-F family ATP-binding cassette domain-containing protein, partial [Eggerthellaceae bacterium]|nr:ABC-F family ATP-binding cassette domain-containing protein [Eggerthellaceae bacterium]